MDIYEIINMLWEILHFDEFLCVGLGNICQFSDEGQEFNSGAKIGPCYGSCFSSTCV